MSTQSSLIASNRKASFNYQLFDKFEAGIVLLGSEVKALRLGRVNLTDAYVTLDKEEVFLWNSHIGIYDQAGPFNHKPLRTRKLLLHRNEIDKLIGKVSEKGFSLVPTKLYFKNGKVKCEFALGKGKKLHDKRQSIKERDQNREVEKYLKQR